MAEFIRPKISDIHIGERARPIDEDVAQAIAASMAERGQISPIMVRRTPNANKGGTPLTLVAGGHRVRGAVINDWTEIDAIVVAADAVEAQLLELSENIYRNDLSALDRAVFVLKFRELWEDKHGKIDRTRNLKVGADAPKGHDAPSGKQGSVYPVIFADGRELSKAVQTQLGFGPDVYKRAVRIGQNLHPALRSALRGTGGDRDQSLLLKLAKKGPSEQAAIASTLRETGDLKQTLAWLKGDKPAIDLQEDIFQKVTRLLGKADDETLLRLLHHIGDQRDASFLEAAE